MQVMSLNFQSRLLDWFKMHARPLPWRKAYHPYEVWISEIMLQQTQVETMLPYFDRWMDAFPDVAALAAADEKKVLKLWQGLGYYSRARNLHRNAKWIMAELSGRFPEDFETILSLKGVGRYTAGAIASIAFNEPRPIVDGNVLRVLSRLYAIKEPIDVPRHRERFWKLEERLIPDGEARAFNQALMELGALLCTAREPACLVCPVNRFCKAYKTNRADQFPVRANKKKTVKVEAGAIVLSRSGRYLIHKRPLGKIMGGLWEFPEWKLAEGRSLSPNEVKTRVLKHVREEMDLPVRELRYLETIKRNYTRYSESLRVFMVELPGTRTFEQVRVPGMDWPSVWASKADFRKYPFSSAHAKITELL
ncbi:MAG: A/G-specific adenine glycosylase [Omnitrophica bacterium RIFCSPHIGHO2_02_FULL_63_14]|nr:MAG: A/G-specific adenine glycosylase [Omnitrophica bacterium RIFCSPHIGHO2_02_FULL_63_14]